MPVEIKQITAFIRRDFHSWTTYKTAMTTQIINILIAVFSWGISATYVQKPVSEMYGSDYISFLIVGVAISNLIMPLAQGVQAGMNPWTLETTLMTGISTPVFVFGNTMWTYILSILSFIPYLPIGIYMFHVHLNVNPASTIVAFIISAAILMGLSMISTGVRMVTKSTDPITWGINVLSNLFAGVAFPVIFLDTILFKGASNISWFLPQTWVYHLCRLAMLTDASLLNTTTAIEFLKGAAFAVVFLPVGYLVLRWGINRAKKEGNLGWY